MRESKFQADLIKELKQLFPDCIIQKLPTSTQQGLPDLLILYNDRWATLECKKSKDERVQPNQVFFVKKMKKMSYSAFIFPENKEQVLNELQQALSSRRQACAS